MASGTPTNKVLSEGYTFMNTEVFISAQAKEILVDLLKKAENRNPDSFDMYIYNDYYPYAVHNLIDTTFAVVKTKVNKKDWKDAFYAIEALTIFFEFESAWTSCDDGDLTKATNKLYGSLLLEILKGLKGADQLSSKTFPNLENILHSAFTFGGYMKNLSCNSAYTNSCKAIANSIFKDTTTADQALYEARLREYADSIKDEEAKSEMLEDIDEYVKRVKKEKNVWYMKGKVGNDVIKTTGLAKAWSEYRGMAPTAPFRGPPEWDLTKWSKEDKEQFLFDNMDDE